MITAISAAARPNHDEPFPSDLDLRTRLLAQLAALIASQTLAEFDVMAAAALGVGTTPVGLKEIIYQAVPYVGMAKAFDFCTSPTRSSPNAAWSRPYADSR
jgi:alkylhydroperoxidase/carboxymuconolactone decarboxylase family protein YurZ